MAAENTINLLKWWYPEGLDVTVSHDHCGEVTGRYDVWVLLPDCNGADCATKRTPLQRWINTRNLIQKKRMSFVWRNQDYIKYDYKVNGRLLLLSMKYLGSDQYLYDRPDTWQCFWKAIEVASIGWNDPEQTMKLEENNYFFKGLGPSTFPKPPTDPGENCGVPFAYPKVGFNIEAWMFQRVFTPSEGSDWVGSLFAKLIKPGELNTNVAKTWAACRFWYDTHTFGYARIIPFGAETPAQYAARQYPQYWPNGIPSMPNPYAGQIKVNNEAVSGAGEKFDTVYMQEPVTSGDGGFNATGNVITPPP